jgi:hypothetical protein
MESYKKTSFLFGLVYDPFHEMGFLYHCTGFSILSIDSKRMLSIEGNDYVHCERVNQFLTIYVDNHLITRAT